MTDITLKKLFVAYAKIEQIKLFVEAMKQENLTRIAECQSAAYNDNAFLKEADAIGEIISEFSQEIVEFEPRRNECCL